MTQDAKRINLKTLQRKHSEWRVANFGDSKDEMESLAGVTEELGELARALLKRREGIRGSADEHDKKGKDAVGDAVLYLMSLCSKVGWDIEECISIARDEVHNRDWKENPKDGSKKAEQRQEFDGVSTDPFEDCEDILP